MVSSKKGSHSASALENLENSLAQDELAMSETGALFRAVSEGRTSSGELAALAAPAGSLTWVDPYTHWTPLVAAAQAGNIEYVRELLRLGAPPGQVLHIDGSTPLSHAATEGHTKVTQLLLDAGAEANSRQTSPADMTPLHLAACMGHTQ
eukprot:114088-Rhodomonas_salina.1